MPELEFLYFPIHGRAFIARTIMQMGDVACKDTIVTFAEFAKMKTDLPLGQVPVLKIDGTMYCQSVAIINYLAAQAGLAKLTDVEELTSTMIFETCSEIFDGSVKPAFGASKADPEADQAKKSGAFYATLKKLGSEQLKKLEKILTHISAGDSVIGGKTSVADIAILNIYMMFTDKGVNMESEWKSIAPTAAKIVDSCLKDAKMAKIVTDARALPFFPM